MLKSGFAALAMIAIAALAPSPAAAQALEP